MSFSLLVVPVLLFAICLLPACKQAPAPSGKASPERSRQQELLEKNFEASKKVVAARVNGQPITEFAVLREMNTIAPSYLTGGRQRTPELDAKIRSVAVNILTFQELAVQVARARGMKVPQETIDRELAKLRKDAGSEERFRTSLSNNGLTEAELRSDIEHDRLFEMIALHEVDAKISITEAALRELYARRKKELVSPDAAHRQLGFAESRPRLDQMAREGAGEKRMKAWEMELKKGARIEIATTSKK